MSERDVKEILILTAPDPSDDDISALFESFPDACLILNPALRIAAASETYLRATMIDRDKIIGHSISEVFPDNPAGPAAEVIERGASELARADEVELDKDAMLHLITDAAPVLIAYVDADERYRFTNKTYEEWFGRSRADILGKPVVEVLGEAAHAALRPHIEAALAGQSVSYEATIPYKDGGARHTLGTITPHFDGDGTVKGFVAVVSDITERKRVEEALRDSERRYRDIIENARDIVYTHDLAGRFTSLNRVIEQITGYTPEETLAMNIADLIAPEYMEQARRMVAQKISGGGLTVHDLEIVAKDGRRVTLEINSRPLYHNGVVAGIQGIARDITERKRAEEEREDLFAREQAARAEAEKANRLKDEFLATLSHELRTPLTAILGWAHLLRTGQIAEGGADRAIETIERSARSQSQLIEDLLDISRIITGKLRLDVRPTDCCSFIDAAIKAMQPAATAKNIRLQKLLDTNVGMMSGDPDRLQQVVWNLLSNAIKFTPKGGRVQVRLTRVNSHIEISVRDTGVGIGAEFLPFVFDRFRQADGSTTRHYGGLGLGLAITRHLVELHGGIVRAESPGEGQGAAFTVELPVMPVYEPERRADRAHPSTGRFRVPLDCPESLDGLKILVVDDEAETRELLEIVLGNCGAQVSTAGSSGEALQLLAELKPDVLISDIGMPVEDGYELIRRVRALPAERGGKVPAVALTAYARAEDRLRVLRSGYQMHVTKPVELPELIAIVASLIKR